MVYTATENNNPMGAVAYSDGGAPDIFTARVIANVSGGQFVMISGTDGANIVGSAANSVVANDFNIAPALLYDNVIGLALYNVASGTSNYVAVARRGDFLVQSTDVVSGGWPVTFSSGGVVNIFGIGSHISEHFLLGRAMNSADSGGYTLLHMNI